MSLRAHCPAGQGCFAVGRRPPVRGRTSLLWQPVGTSAGVQAVHTEPLAHATGQRRARYRCVVQATVRHDRPASPAHRSADRRAVTVPGRSTPEACEVLVEGTAVSASRMPLRRSSANGERTFSPHRRRARHGAEAHRRRGRRYLAEPLRSGVRDGPDPAMLKLVRAAAVPDGGSVGMEGSEGAERLPRLRLDELLEELQVRIDAVRGTRDRVHSLLEAVLSVGRELDLPQVLRRHRRGRGRARGRRVRGPGRDRRRRQTRRSS